MSTSTPRATAQKVDDATTDETNANDAGSRDEAFERKATAADEAALKNEAGGGFNVEEFYARRVSIAFGRNKNDEHFRNWEGTLGDLIGAHFGGHVVGPKDGPCLTQSGTTNGRRLARTMIGPSILMVDHDTGESMDEVEALYKSAGLYAILWHTHSHMTTESDVGEGGLTNFLRKDPTWRTLGQTEPALDEPEVLLAQVKDYFKTKRYVPALLDTFTDVRRDVADGAKYIVTHAPMSKLRSLLVLDEQFKLLEGGLQKDRIEEWRQRYAGFCVNHKIPYDRSCVDPSRLMYLPRRPHGSNTDMFEIREVEGRTVTLDDMPRHKANTRQLDAFAEAARELGSGLTNASAGKATTFTTKNLRRFMAQGGSSFAIAEWLRTVEPEIRGDRDNKLTICCPNDDNHSNPGDPKDVGFWVKNAQDNEENVGFSASCSHDTCKGMSEGDRAWYLDLLCQQHGVDDAMELREFCDEWKESREEVEADVAANCQIAFEQALASIPEDASAAQLQTIAKVIALGEGGVVEEERINAVCLKTKRTTRDRRRPFENEVKQARKRHNAARRGAGETSAPLPTTDGGNVIYDHWGHNDKKHAAIAALEKLNDADPHIFVDVTGKYVRLSKRGDSTHLEPIEGRDKWSAVLSDNLIFKCVETDRAPEREVKPFEDVVGYLAGAKNLNAPTLKRIVNVPVFGADGVLRTDEGYCASGKTWLDPSMPFRAVPDVITERDVGEAGYWFGEALIDFPFSDFFEGADPYPVKGDEKDADGHALAPSERGIASHSHAIAMCLTPFIRAMIKDGKAPAFLIDKSEPGSGAGYLADVQGYMLYGTAMPAKDLPTNEEEVSKVLLASFMRGRPAMFLDNINHEVESPSLAAALTASSIEGRVLGKSEYIDVDVETVIILAANNGKLADELIRRVIPIRLDHALPDPSATRPPEFYKHVHHDFLHEHRADLVWSAHVLVKWWQQNGSPDPSHGRRLQSFSDWSRIMGGILELGGIPGFLASLPAFNAARKEGRSDEVAFLKRVLHRFPVGKTWTVSDAYSCACPMGSDMPDPELGLPLKGRDPAGLTLSLGHTLKKWVGKTYAINGLNCQLVKHKEEGGKRYAFVLAV